MHGECQSPERTENVKHVLARNRVSCRWWSLQSIIPTYPRISFFPAANSQHPQRHLFARFHYFCLKIVFVMNRAEILLHFLDIRWRLMNVSIIQHLLSFVNENMKLGHLFYRNFCLTLLMRCLQATQTVAVR